MTNENAQALIAPGVDASKSTQHWTDLGCGSGTFTVALAHAVGAGIIMAVDRDPDKLKQVPDAVDDVSIVKKRADMTKIHLPAALDGILMANSIHFIQDKKRFLPQVMGSLNEDGRLLVVEYDTSNGNPWVPYPIPFAELGELLVDLGLPSPHKIGHANSRYHAGGIYCALAVAG